MNVFISTFGCKVNSFESAAMAQILRENGDVICEIDACADVVIVNSCTVTANGDKKVRQYLHRVKRENPSAITVLTGCFPQAFPELAAQYTQADIICGTGERKAIARLIKDFAERRERIVEIVPNAKKAFEPLRADSIEGHTRAFMKIEDGCDRYCSYCIIPFARGPVRSMPLEEIKAQTQDFVRAGYAEIVLSGINLSKYGSDMGLTLADAVECVCAVDGVARVRLGSLEPDLTDERLIDRLAKCEKLCPQFHLALQSGCDATLARMHRRYDTALYSKTVARLREAFERPSFTSDVIVGFAGETDEEFAQSLAFVRSIGFLKLHVFPYSKREGTAGAKLPNQLDNKTKSERAAQMSAAAELSRAEVLRSFIGTRVRVILETEQPDGSFDGYTDRYAPALVYGEGLQARSTVCGIVCDVRDDKCIVNI